MHFDCKLAFLGMAENHLQDGTVYYRVSFFDKNGGGTVEVNVMGTRRDVVELLSVLDFGSPVVGHFALIQKDKLYRLSLAGLDTDGGQ